MATFDFDDDVWDKLVDGFEDVLEEIWSVFDGHEILFLLEEELDVESELMEMGLYKTVMMRQATTIESLLASVIQITIEDERDVTLSNREVDFLQQRIGPKAKVYLAYWFGIIEHDFRNALLELMGERGSIAHDAWLELEIDEEESETRDKYERIAERIHAALKSELEDGDWL